MFETESKSAETRARVRDAALRSFRERGYKATTMRLVATQAGVALGNAYYYFPSKAHLVQEMYASVVAEQVRSAEVALARESGLAERIAAAWRAAIEAGEQYHELGVELLSEAIRPGSPLSPFSPESTPARETSQAVFRDAVSVGRVPTVLRDELPLLLWLTQLGIEIFWLYDSSEGRRKTHLLIDGLAPLVASLVRLARLPVARGIVEDAVALLHRVRS